MARTKTTSPCFTPGTRIATARGWTPIEDIREGDRLLTADNGLRPVVWIGRRRIPRAELLRSDELMPVLIQAGALGEGRPDRAMIVSPKHRFVVDHVNAHGAREEVLMAADRLINHGSIKPVAALGVTYIHLLCEQHQVLLADGACAESFRPDASTWQRIGTAQRLEIEALFPEARDGGLERLSDPARPLDDRPLWKQRMGRSRAG